MKPKHQRLAFVCVSVAFLCIATLMTMRAFRENLVFFYSPSEVENQLEVNPKMLGRTIRLGGLVTSGSIKKDKNQNITFDVSDGKGTITIEYQGMLPNLFREEQGVVVEGELIDHSHFKAKSVLAKHDEKYMPREVVDALKRTGQWKGSEGK